MTPSRVECDARKRRWFALSSASLPGVAGLRTPSNLVVDHDKLWLLLRGMTPEWTKFQPKIDRESASQAVPRYSSTGKTILPPTRNSFPLKTVKRPDGWKGSSSRRISFGVWTRYPYPAHPEGPFGWREKAENSALRLQRPSISTPHCCEGCAVSTIEVGLC